MPIKNTSSVVSRPPAIARRARQTHPPVRPADLFIAFFSRILDYSAALQCVPGVFSGGIRVLHDQYEHKRDSLRAVEEYEIMRKKQRLNLFAICGLMITLLLIGHKSVRYDRFGPASTL